MTFPPNTEEVDRWNANGSSNPSGLALYEGTSNAAGDYTQQFLSFGEWFDVSEANFLDLTDPLAPVLNQTGLFSLITHPYSFSLAGNGKEIYLEFRATRPDSYYVYDAKTIGLPPTTGGFAQTLTLVNYLPVGTVLSCFVYQNTTVTRSFSLATTIQRLI